MEIKLIDKLLYRPVVNKVYSKPYRRLGRIIGINGNSIFCVEQEPFLISIKDSRKFMFDCSLGTYKIIKHVNDYREWTRPLDNGKDKLIISKQGVILLANDISKSPSGDIFRCATNDGKIIITNKDSIEVVGQTKLFSSLLKYAQEGRYDYNFFNYWISEEWRRFPRF